MRVLLINTAHLGDVISSTIVSEAFFTRESSVDFLMPPAFFSLFEEDPRYVLTTLEQAQQKEYDLIVDLDSSQKSRKVIKLLNAKKKVGRYNSLFKRLKYFRIYDHQVKKWPYTHVVKDYEPILDYFNLPKNHLPFIKRVKKPDLQSRLGKLREKHSQLIVAHFGSASYLRQTPARLAKELIVRWREKGAFIFLVGTEKEIIEPLAALFPDCTEHFRGTLGSVADLIQLCDLTLASDSGIIHITGALQKPGLVLNGPTLSSATKPLSPTVVAYELDFSCRPCNQNKACRYDQRCLKQMTADKVDFQLQLLKS